MNDPKVGSSRPHIFRSANPWTPSVPSTEFIDANTSTLPASSTAPAIAWTKGSPNPILAAAVRDLVFKTTIWTYNGATWTKKTDLPGSSSAPRALSYPGVSFPAANAQLFHGNVSPYETHDFGASWNQLGLMSGNIHGDTRAIHFDGNLGFVWGTTDGNVTGFASVVRWNWAPGLTPYAGIREGDTGFRTWQLYSAGVVPYDFAGARHAFVTSQDNGVMCSNDLDNWTQPQFTADSPSIVFAPSNPAVAYFRENNDIVYSTSNATASACTSVSWTPHQAAYATPDGLWTRNMTAVHPTSPSTLIAAMGANHVGVSTTGGSSWQYFQLTPTSPFPTSISVQIDAGGTYYAGTESYGLFTSTNGGTSWTQSTLGATPPRFVLGIVKSTAGGGTGTLFAATTDGLYRQVNGGAWSVVTGGGGYTVSDIAVDPNCPTRVYAALGFVADLGAHRGGLRFSSDNGTNWTCLSCGVAIHEIPLADVEVDALNPSWVYVGSFGRGLWKYDWNGSLPACSP